MGWASTLVRDHHYYHSDRLTHGGVASRLLRARRDYPMSALSLLSHSQVASISYSAWRGCRLHWTRVRCAPRTEQQDCLGKEEKERPQEGDEIKGPDVGNSSFATKGVKHDKASLVKLVVFWIFAAVVFGVGVGIKDGVEKASEFFAGYILEKSLSVDNLFVFVLVFKYFNVPVSYQSRVLSYGISGAVAFRATMILLGTATLQRFEAVNLLLAVILIYSSYKLFVAEEEETDLSNNFIVKTCQKFIPITSYYDGNRFITIQDGVRKATPLLLTLAVIELSDIAFAIDSIPAVFGVTRDPFIVFSSNIFAILGLRSLYVLISETVGELKYLQGGLHGNRLSPFQRQSRLANGMCGPTTSLSPACSPYRSLVSHSQFGVAISLAALLLFVWLVLAGHSTDFHEQFSCTTGGKGLQYWPAIGVVLGFIGSKMILDYFGYRITTEASLGIVATTLGAGILLSLVKKSDD